MTSTLVHPQLCLQDMITNSSLPNSTKTERIHRVLLGLWSVLCQPSQFRISQNLEFRPCYKNGKRWGGLPMFLPKHTLLQPCSRDPNTTTRSVGISAEYRLISDQLYYPYITAQRRTSSVPLRTCKTFPECLDITNTYVTLKHRHPLNSAITPMYITLLLHWPREDDDATQK